MNRVNPMITVSAPAALGPFASAGVFGPAEVHGASVICRADPHADDTLLLAAALALWAPLHGHACVDLDAVEGMVCAEVAVRRADTASEVEVIQPLPWPTPEQCIAALRRSSVCRVVAGAGPDGADPLDDHPLVLDGHLLYTQRQWIDEHIVADELRRRCSPEPRSRVDDHSNASIAGLPATDLDGTPNLQHEAVSVALRSPLSVIVGGPGTGKTYTIARLLAAVVHRGALRGGSAQIALAAPTGKAAARMGEALGLAVASFSEDEAVAARLRELHPTTIHHLLGGGRQRTRFTHGPGRLLDADLVVIDEASMVALPLMARLLEAIRPDAQLVLVGDPDQLESIEVGSVLADIVHASAVPGAPLAEYVVRLVRPRRQTADSPIGPLADAIRQGDAAAVLALLRGATADSTGDQLVTFVDTGTPGLAASSAAQVDAVVGGVVLPGLQASAAAARSGDGELALSEFAGVRVLCAHRRGPFGVQRWNRVIETALRPDEPSSRDYAGRPLLATRNDPRQRIANGDTGVVIETSAGRRAAFMTGTGLRLLTPAQLDAVETAYAMTIHKSQGSEYDTVVIILPPADSPLAGRELLYTAITRATRRVVVVGSSAAVVACVNSPTRRVTGLTAALTG